jgi:hypothetical protein
MVEKHITFEQLFATSVVWTFMKSDFKVVYFIMKVMARESAALEY